MISKDNLDDILSAARGTAPDVGVSDVVFLILYGQLEDKCMAYHFAYGTDVRIDTVDKHVRSKAMKSVIKACAPFGIGLNDDEVLSREENQRELTKMLADIDAAMASGDLETGQGLKMKMDIRVKLQDKFDMDDSDDSQKHIIVVPQKHDLVCEYTHRECCSMPTKEACMKYYGLVDGGAEISDKERKFNERDEIDPWQR